MNPIQQVVSIIIPTFNEGGNLVDTVKFLYKYNEERVKSGQLEVIVVDDGSTDGSIAKIQEHYRSYPLRVIKSNRQGVAKARNLGAEKAAGDILIFLDGHCYTPRGWLEPLLALFINSDNAQEERETIGMVGPTFCSIREPHIKACGMTWKDATLKNVWFPCGREPVQVPFTTGACQVVPANIFRAVGGYDTSMTRWGSEDIELCLRLWLLGYTIYAQPESIVYHLFRSKHPYPINSAHVHYNHLRMALLHFDEDRLARVIKHMAQIPGIEASFAKAFADNTINERQRLLAVREHDMDWFCQRFGIAI